MGLFDEVMAVSGLAGSAQSGQHAGALGTLSQLMKGLAAGR